MATTPDQFAARLQRIAAQAEARADVLEDRWGDNVAEEMRSRVPVRTGTLKASIQQTAPGVVTVGADYGVYVDRGTSRMPPQEFVRPALNAERRRIVNEGIDEAVDWLLGR
jgi:HK97 gp10 family phage protein